MFSRQGSLTIHSISSPSLLPNNLSVTAQKDLLLYVRFSEVVICEPNGDAVILPVAKSTIYQAAFVNVNGTDMIAITTNLGVQFWSKNGQNMLFFYSAKFDQEDEHFLRGIASVQDSVCIGSSSGNILVFGSSDSSAKGSADDNQFSLAHSLVTTRSAISCLGSSGLLLAGGNDNGDVYAFNPNSAFEIVFKHDGNGIPCTTISVRDFTVFAGYSSGHIRILRGDIGELSLEISAHSRPVTGLVLHPFLNIFASCSEDQFLHVWNIPDFSSRSACDVDVLFSDKLHNSVCTGVAFLKDDKICVASYDDNSLVLYKKD